MNERQWVRRSLITIATAWFLCVRPLSAQPAAPTPLGLDDTLQIASTFAQQFRGRVYSLDRR